jgi:hypothetical protein
VDHAVRQNDRAVSGCTFGLKLLYPDLFHAKGEQDTFANCRLGGDAEHPVLALRAALAGLQSGPKTTMASGAELATAIHPADYLALDQHLARGGWILPVPVIQPAQVLDKCSSAAG